MISSLFLVNIYTDSKAGKNTRGQHKVTNLATTPRGNFLLGGIFFVLKNCFLVAGKITDTYLLADNLHDGRLIWDVSSYICLREYVLFVLTF